MILICPNCSTRYSVSDAAVGAAGRQVKCTRCGHSWWQAPPETPREPPAAEAAPPPAPEAPEPTPAAEPAARPFRAELEIDRPPTRPRRPARRGLVIGWAALALLLLAGTAGLLAGRDPIVAAWPQAARLYHGLGLLPVPAGAGLEFRGVSPDWQAGPDGTALVIEGEIANLTDDAREVPPVRVVLRDASDAEVGSRIVALDVARLGPKEAAPFRVDLGPPAAGAAAVALSFAAPAGGG